MPKMKTKKAVTKRFRKTGSGKLKRQQGYRLHNAHGKTKKQKRHLKKGSYVHPSDAKRIISLI